MACSRVEVTRDLYGIMLTHALSEEREEVMGLLCGDVAHDARDGGLTVRLWAAAPQSRSDRRRDRVESTPVQLADASQEAERATAATGVRTRILGCARAVTVLPSAVDVRTQASYQSMDSGFVGVIFSVFNSDAEGKQSIQVVAFQSQPAAPPPPDVTAWGTPVVGARSAQDGGGGGGSGGGLEHRLVPLVVVPSQGFRAWPHRLAPLLALQRTLLAEEDAAYEAAVGEAGGAEGAGCGCVARLAASAAFQCRCAALLQHSVAPLLQALSGRLRCARAAVAMAEEEAAAAQTLSDVEDEGTEDALRL